MANNGAGTDDETWEDASDVYEIRSEAGDSEPERSEKHDLQGSSTQTTLSHYQIAMQSQPRGRRDSRRNRSPTLPELGHYRMQCPECQKQKESEAASGAVSRSVKSRRSSNRRSEVKESITGFDQPGRSRPDQRPVEMKNDAPVLSAGSDSSDGRPATSFDKTHPSSSNVQYPASRLGDESSEATASNDTGLAKEWMEYMRKYPPPPVVPPVQPECWVPQVQPDCGVPPVRPEHWVPPVQPERRVPQLQPEYGVVQAQPESRVPRTQPDCWVPPAQSGPWVPPAQPGRWVSLTQPQMPSVQPVLPSDKTMDCRIDEESNRKMNNRRDAINVKSEAETKVCPAGNTYYIEVKIGKKRCSGLLDTGSEVTLLPKQLADMSQIIRSSRKLKAANGTIINIVGEWRTIVNMGPLNVAMNFIVSDQIDEILIGIDWLSEHRCLLSFADLTITLQGYCFPMLKKVYSGSCISEEGVIIPDKSEAVIPGKRMPKRKAANEKEAVNCSECGKAFQRQTDANRHFDMVHLMIEHDCRHCGTTLGSVSALRRHLEVQHRVKLSTRPGTLPTSQWRLIPVESATAAGAGGKVPDRHESAAVVNEPQRVCATRSASTMATPISLSREEGDVRRRSSTGIPVVVEFNAGRGYMVTSDPDQEPGGGPPRERSWMERSSEEEERVGRRQLEVWREELRSTFLPIDKEQWLTKWRGQSPRFGFSTLFAAEAMIDGYLVRSNASEDGRDICSPYVTRKGAVAT